MAIKRYKPEQIVTLLWEVEVGIGNGKSTPAACNEPGIAAQTYCRWGKEYGGLKLEQAKRMKELEKERSSTRIRVLELTFTCWMRVYESG